MDSLMDFSLNISENLNGNILNKKLISLIKNNKMYGGGYIDSSNYIILIIGIVVLIVGFILYLFKNDWIEIKANIKNISCVNQNETDNTECNVSIEYIVNSIQYLKMITMCKSDISTNQYISIYYQESDPNTMRLYNFNYSIIGIGLIVLGIFVIATSICSSTQIQYSSNALESESNLYTSTRDANGVNVVYTK